MDQRETMNVSWALSDLHVIFLLAPGKTFVKSQQHLFQNGQLRFRLSLLGGEREVSVSTQNSGLHPVPKVKDQGTG